MFVFYPTRFGRQIVHRFHIRHDEETHIDNESSQSPKRQTEATGEHSAKKHKRSLTIQNLKNTVYRKHRAYTKEQEEEIVVDHKVVLNEKEAGEQVQDKHEEDQEDRPLVNIFSP